MSTTPGYLALSGTEAANSARTAAYLAAGLGSPQFEVVFDEPCAALTDFAWPLEVCAEPPVAFASQFYASPLASLRVPTTGASPPPAASWDASGWISPGAVAGAASAGFLLPDPGQVDLRVVVQVNPITFPAATNRMFAVSRVVNAGTANVGWAGIGLQTNGTTWTLVRDRQVPNGGAGSTASILSLGNIPTGLAARWGSENVWLEVIFSSTGVVATLYGNDPDADVNAPVIGTAAYGYDSTPGSAWQIATGQTEAAQLATATEVGILNANTAIQFFGPTELVLSAITVSSPCTATGTSYPAAGAWPGENLYPGSYGYFTNPGNDNAPWVDPEQPASYGFLGLVLTDMKGWDTTETRSLDAAATGRGGILGPQQLAPRRLQCKGFLVAQDCAAMEYGRRWLADALAGEFRPGCDSQYVDILPLCGAADETPRRRLYDVGLESLEADTDDPVSCCYVTPVDFTLAVASPYIYTVPETVIASQALAPLSPDTPEVPFETWLFGQPAEICVDLADEGLGDEAAIVALYGGTSGISGGLVFRSQGHYPQASMFPGECVYPADGTPQWDISTCPFVFDVSIGPGEWFTVDSSRERMDWQLEDGTVLAGAPRLALEPGQVVQWINTCDGEDAQVCVQAFANCSCDTSAAVSVALQHRER